MSDTKHINESEAQELIDFMRYLMDWWGLPRYWIKVQDTPPEDAEAQAEIIIAAERYVLSLYLCKDWRDLSDYQRLHTIVHEVCHISHRRIDTVVRRTENLMHDHEWAVVNEDYRVEMELWVDQLANALARSAPIRRKWAQVTGQTLETTKVTI